MDDRNMRQNNNQNRAEQAARARGSQAGAGLAADEQALIGMARLALSLAPGHVAMRQQVARLRAALERRLSVDDAAYVVIAELSALLDRDALAMLSRRLPAGPDLGPASRQDPVVALYRLGRIDAGQLRAAREIQQVAEMMAGGAVGGVKAMDPAAIRVDGGTGQGMDLATYRAGHHAAARVGDFMAAMALDSRVFCGRDGRDWTAADIFRAVVVDRRSIAEVERKVVAHHRTVARLVGQWLGVYVDDAAAIWAVMDSAEKRET
jgi:hypothetical protein